MKKIQKILVTTHPISSTTRDLLSSLADEVFFNQKGSKYTQEEVDFLLESHNPDVIIAGTEKYSKKQFDLAPNLKMISRVGAGLSSIDLEECNERGIAVRNDSDSHTDSVAELALGLMFSALRKIPQSDNDMHRGIWKKRQGRDLLSSHVLIVGGNGRVGSKLAKMLLSLGVAYEVVDVDTEDSLEEMLPWADIISIHVPLNSSTIGMFSKEQFNLMKEDVILINTSRGEVIDEMALDCWLYCNPEATVALDVFWKEPYDSGLLSYRRNTILTPHIGSLTKDTRFHMECTACKNVSEWMKEE